MYFSRGLTKFCSIYNRAYRPDEKCLMLQGSKYLKSFLSDAHKDWAQEESYHALYRRLNIQYQQ